MMKTRAHFNAKTFNYFKNAKANRNKRTWFEKNRELYEAEVKGPMVQILEKIRRELQEDLPRIRIDSKVLTRPLNSKNKSDQGLVKTTSHFTLWEKRTSLFEWNPTIYFQIGNDPEDNVLGVGLYMVSSRQMSLMRTKIAEEYLELNEILTERKFKQIWRGFEGEKFVRYPKGFPIDQPYSKLLMNKQFFIARHFTKQELKSPKLAQQIGNELRVAMPFFKFVRATVGVYSRRS